MADTEVAVEVAVEEPAVTDALPAEEPAEAEPVVAASPVLPGDLLEARVTRLERAMREGLGIELDRY